MKHTLLALALGASALQCGASVFEADSTAWDYRPVINITLRPRFEWSTATGQQRFQVKNSDFTLSGRVHPAVQYALRADYCLSGRFQVLDAWARVDPGRGFGVQAGQFRMPFGVESFRAPHTYYFSNRSFMGKQMCNYRAVGAKGIWEAPSLPLVVEAGVFNPTTIADHTPWNRSVAFSGKASYTLGQFTLTGGGMSLRPDLVRMNLWDACAEWRCGRWYAAAEYMHEHYTHNAHRPAKSVVAFADYKMPIRTQLFNRLSFQGRYDWISDHSSGWRDDNGRLVTETPARHRLTVGSTLSYVHRSGRFLDLRLDYEQFFGRNRSALPVSDRNMAVAELVLHL